jgi:hypothetical protein
LAELEYAVATTRELVVTARRLALEGLQLDRKQRRRRLRKQLWRALQPWRKHRRWMEEDLEDKTWRSEDLLELFNYLVKWEKVRTLN